MSLDPTVCLVHPRKRQQVGVCHLCLKDRLLRLSLSDSSGSHASLLPSTSSRSSFDSSDNTSSGANALGAATASANSKHGGKLGTIFSLMESDSEEMAARIEEEEETDHVDEEEVPSYMLRSKSVSQWPTQPPRRSSCNKDRLTGTDPGSNAGDGLSAKPNGTHTPLISASATPVVNHVDRDHNLKGTTSKNHLSWISSLFRLGKRKKKSSHNGAVETNFFPPEAWNDDFRHSASDRDRLWRSRSVSSGRVIKKSFTPLVVGEDPVASVTGTETAPPRSSTVVEPPSRVSSLIALDMREATTKVQMAGDVAVDKSYVAVPGRASVASLMDIDRKYVESTCAPSPTGLLLQRSRSTGGWRRKIRSESPSSVLIPPGGNATATTTPGNEWSFYLTPLRTFGRNRSSRHAR